MNCATVLFPNTGREHWTCETNLKGRLPDASRSLALGRTSDRSASVTDRRWAAPLSPLTQLRSSTISASAAQLGVFVFRELLFAVYIRCSFCRLSIGRRRRLMTWVAETERDDLQVAERRCCVELCDEDDDDYCVLAGYDHTRTSRSVC